MDFLGKQAIGDGGVSSSQMRLSVALEDFRRARREAAMKAILGRLRGSSLELLSYGEVTDKLHITGQVDQGVHEIPLEKIVGSVGRYQDFDSSFLPLRRTDAQRWASVQIAAPDPNLLPPIDVYQINDAYFVIDGNHRVSIARRMGMEYLAAHVTEVRTRVPLPADLEHDDLILASEYAAFLEHTKLDKLRSSVDLKTSLPGQHDKVENHIEVHRFFIEMSKERELSDEEAVLRWYDEAYLPVVETIREHGLLREFPGRTETDLYLWIAENQAALHNELGWEISPQIAAAKLAPQFDTPPGGRLSRFYRRVLHAVLPANREERARERSWLEQKTMDRYSDRLFAALLVIIDQDLQRSVLDQAINLAQVEKAHLFAIQLYDGEQSEDPVALARRTQAQFAAKLQEAGVSGEIGFEEGDAREIVRRLAPLADLLVVDKELLSRGSVGPEIVEPSVRPILVTSDAPRKVGRVLFICDDRPQAHEALFVVAYMAEMWGSKIVMLADPNTGSDMLEKATRYLELHETTTENTITRPLSPSAVLETAGEYQCDLIVVAGYNKRPLSKSEMTTWLMDTHEKPLPLVLICP